MGAGKNYWGEALARGLGVEFFDGDTVIHPVMLGRVRNFKPITLDILADYIYDHLLPAIIKKANESKNLTTALVVAQALYDDGIRRDLSTILKDYGFEVEYFWIKTSFWKNLKQIFSRPRGFRWVIYWLMNKPFFQKPTHNYYTIDKISLNENALVFKTHLNVLSK